MKSKLNRVAFSASMILLFLNYTLLAQQKDSFIKLQQLDGRNVPKSLLTVVSLDLETVPLEQALTTVAAEGNFKLNYNRNRIPINQTVSLNVENAYALEALLEILQKTRTELLITREGQLVIVPARPKPDGAGVIKGQVVDAATKSPLFGTNISILGINTGGTSGPDGNFSIKKVPFGEYTLQFSYMGYEVQRIANLTVDENHLPELQVELVPKTILLEEVTVTPGQFSIMGKGPTVQKTLTRADLETVPFGEDIYRAMTRLPGIAASDFSAKFTVRGGENDEILVLLDGMELYEPFHLKEIEGGALSIIDVAAIEGIDLMTGGFSAEYGDRKSGVFNIKSTRAPVGKKRTALGLSFMNARVMSQGTFNNEKGAWLVSARRGYLDLVMDIMGETNPPKPVFYDFLSKFEYQLGDKHRLSAHFLHAGDRFDFVEDDDDEDFGSYDNTYTWLTVKSFPSQRIFVQSVASFGNLTQDRKGLAFLGDLPEIDFEIRDKKKVNFFGFKQSWNIDISDNYLLKWGFEFKNFTADYDYLSSKRRVVWLPPDNLTIRTDSTTFDFNPNGRKFGVYLSNRIRVLSPLTAELGLRYDSNSFTDDKHVSPRVNLLYALGKQTFLRGGWGYFYQSQEIHDIKVSDGEDGFFPAERSIHWVAGMEHTVRNGLNLRLEGYYKKLSHLRPDYRNWNSTLEVFPELQDNRFTLNLNGGTAKGLELYLKYDRGGKLSWWASYALAFAEDDVRSLVFSDVEYTADKKLFRGKFDQRHTFFLDVNYRPNKKWHLNLSWQYHTGWPYTQEIIQSTTASDGSVVYFTAYGDFQGTRLPAYHRLDLNFNRHFFTSHGRISLFVGLINAYNRKNLRNIEYHWEWDLSGNQPFLVGEKEYWFKLLPSIGVNWSWDH